MRYMLLIYSDPSHWANLDAAQGEQMMKDYMAFTQRIVESGELVAGDPLQVSEKSCAKVVGFESVKILCPS